MFPPFASIDARSMRTYVDQNMQIIETRLKTLLQISLRLSLGEAFSAPH